MTIHTRPDDQIFAAAAEPGELDSFPDLARGWGVTLDTTKGIPPMEYFNALQQRTDKAIAYLLQRGVAEWSASTEYPQQAITIKNGQVFFAKQQNTNKDPFTNSDVWVNSFAQKANVTAPSFEDSIIVNATEQAYPITVLSKNISCGISLNTETTSLRLYCENENSFIRHGDKDSDGFRLDLPKKDGLLAVEKKWTTLWAGNSIGPVINYDFPDNTLLYCIVAGLRTSVIMPPSKSQNGSKSEVSYGTASVVRMTNNDGRLSFIPTAGRVTAIVAYL